jgi:hypothetical protein
LTPRRQSNPPSRRLDPWHASTVLDARGRTPSTRARSSSSFDAATRPCFRTLRRGLSSHAGAPPRSEPRTSQITGTRDTYAGTAAKRKEPDSATKWRVDAASRPSRLDRVRLIAWPTLRGARPTSDQGETSKLRVQGFTTPAASRALTALGAFAGFSAARSMNDLA